MFDRQVPWALGRRALIRWRIDPVGDGGHVSGWCVAIGVLEDLNIEVGRHEPIWVLDPSNEVDPPPERCVVEHQRLSGMERIPDRVVIATAIVPGQCPRCFESTRPHAPGCVVVANLARGVPAWLAPFAADTWPPSTFGVRIYEVGVEGNLNRVSTSALWRAGCSKRQGPRQIVAIGVDGPTFLPWEQL